MSASSEDKKRRVVAFVQQVVEKLTPAVIEAVDKNSSGHFEVHFASGTFTRARRADML